ncbi:hypothetical protein RUM43_001984 [Polyplax serrata]|uniref:Uncharacterized protein n=1 Tax=Polyplax serrata TaxID=468196 RepID=A0AAN8PD57_POLSC
MGSEHYCLRWNNHQSNLLGVFSQLLQDESLVDVTLACAEGHSIRAHKVVLSACSSYFQTLFVDHPNRHPIVILKDVCFAELRTLVEFMYKGEVNVEYCQLSALLKTAESLKVKGLAEMTNLNATPPSAAVKKENEEKVEDKLEVMASQKSGTNVDPPVATETVNKRLMNEDTNSPSPGRVSSPGPPRSKRPSRGQDSDDTVGCDAEKDKTRERLDLSGMPELPDRNMKGGCPGPTDMSASGLALCQMPPSCSSPHVSEPFPGTSCLPPVQQVPLSLKKEVDWENKSAAGENSLDFRHAQVDSQDGEEEEEADEADEGDEEAEDAGSRTRLYPCMYCGARFPHQSKLTRHILSHSLETLKYREQPHLQMAPPILGLDSLNLMESHYAGRPHKYDNFEQPPDGASDADFSTCFPLGDACQTNLVLCKFCGKSFPDVGSLITHLPVHTGDRPFKCEYCGKAFKLRHHMKDHCRVHTGERPFRCSICGKTFSRSTILKAHEKTHYPKFVHKFMGPSSLEQTSEETSSQASLLHKFSATAMDSHGDPTNSHPQH